MDARTLTALRGSIDKWQQIVAGTLTDEGSENCPLCKFFYEENKGKRSPLGLCNGCPVSERTGTSFCKNTPYPAWTDLQHETEWWKVRDDQTRAAAQAELDFLISLLPEGETA